jgi:hypothetical protein
MVYSTKTGTLTDGNGKFSIAAQPNDNLVIFYIGYHSKSLNQLLLD